MKLAKFLNSLITKNGFILIDANGNKFKIGNPVKENPITLKIFDKSLHFKLLYHPDLYFGEAYTNGSILIENGTLTDFLEIAFENIGRGEINNYGMLMNKLKGIYKKLTNFNFVKNSRKNVAHHYDISEKLYDLFLDEKRQYSCAYFEDEKNTLEEAQNNKINHIIKKLNLKNDLRVLDIGSGWGTLALDIAKKTKCSVLGITLSENQLQYSKQKAKEMNLENQVDFRLTDYRNLNEKFDRVVSVGMFEHVGKEFYKKYFNTVSKLLSENGCLLYTSPSPRDRG